MNTAVDTMPLHRTSDEQVELFEPAEYIDTAGPGYFVLAGRPDGKWRQEPHKVEHLPVVIEGLNPYHDSWITQANFDRPNRRAANVLHVAVLFVDLDTYTSLGLKDKKADELTALLLIYCGLVDLSLPSIVVFSGRGLQAKWLLESAVDAVSLYAWKDAELALVTLFEPLGSDMAARDVSRVLRVDRTVNTKSGELVRVTHVTKGVDGKPVRYDFKELRATLLKLCPSAEPDPRKPTRGTVVCKSSKTELWRNLAWKRYHDLRKLWEIRTGGAVPEHWRELTLFWSLNFLLRTEPGKVEDLWKEAEATAARIDADGAFWQRGDLSSLYARARAMKGGEVVEHAGRVYPPLYTPTNAYLIDLFRITPDEERQMRTIISRQEKRRRDAERHSAARRAAGIPERIRYVGARPWDGSGISRATWFRRRRSGLFVPASFKESLSETNPVPLQEVETLSLTRRDNDTRGGECQEGRLIV